MFEVIRKICRTGIVTRALKSEGTPDGCRGVPVTREDKCVRCASCAKACPTKAIRVFPKQTGSKPLISYERCIFCGVCAEVCENRAIEMNGAYIPAIRKEPEDTAEPPQKTKKIFRKSLHIRHLDSGSCNGCDFEMNMLTSPVYDVQRFGVDFVASPRHADVLMVTGGVTRHLEEAVLKTVNAAASPKIVIAVGTCAAGGGIFGPNYAGNAGVEKTVPVFMHIPGCPPSPDVLIKGILAAMERYL